MVSFKWIKLPPIKKKIEKKPLFAYLLLAYFFIFLGSILIFVLSVIFLDKLVHPLVLSFSFILSAIIIFLYHYFSKREFKGVLWSFSKFFFIATICLFLSVIFFANYTLSRGINSEQKKISFDVYIVNNALSDKEIATVLDYNSKLWSKYNISINYDLISKKKINLDSEEISYLFDKGNTKEECSNYSIVLNKILNNSNKLSIIFLDNNNSNYAGRGCLCNCSFALVSQEKLFFFDFTGWNTAHEIGHVFGLLDIQYYGRTRVNLMNDEFKRLLFFNSDFLSQSQIEDVLNMINNKNETRNIN